MVLTEQSKMTECAMVFHTVVYIRPLAFHGFAVRESGAFVRVHGAIFIVRLSKWRCCAVTGASGFKEDAC